MTKPECPICEDNSGIFSLRNGNWYCGDCGCEFEEEEVKK